MVVYLVLGKLVLALVSLKYPLVALDSNYLWRLQHMIRSIT